MTVILLAAGLAERMGRNKLLLPFRHTTVLGSVIEAVQGAGCNLLIVTGHERERIEAEARRYSVPTIFAEDYSKGQKWSTMKGIKAIRDDDFAILPGDLPLLKPSDILSTAAMLDEYTIARASYISTPGHPVCFRREHREKLLSFKGTMKEYLSNWEIGHCQASEGCVLDVDTPERYVQATGKAMAGG